MTAVGTQKIRPTSLEFIVWINNIDTVQDFLCKLGIKPHMNVTLYKVFVSWTFKFCPVYENICYKQTDLQTN